VLLVHEKLALTRFIGVERHGSACVTGPSIPGESSLVLKMSIADCNRFLANCSPALRTSVADDRKWFRLAFWLSCFRSEVQKKPPDVGCRPGGTVLVEIPRGPACWLSANECRVNSRYYNVGCRDGTCGAAETRSTITFPGLARGSGTQSFSAAPGRVASMVNC